MKITIRTALPEDLDRIMEIYAHARNFMARNGNPSQWGNTYPDRRQIEQDITASHCQVCITESGSIAGVFSLIAGPDPTYNRIEDGGWPDERPYKVIHRLASDGRCSGIAGACIRWCSGQTDCLRADTHRDNRIMQHILEKNGFIKCGTIHVDDGSARTAYQKN